MMVQDLSEIEIQIQLTPQAELGCLHCVIMRALLVERPNGRFSGQEIFDALRDCIRDFALASSIEPFSMLDALESVTEAAREEVEERVA